MTRAATDYLRQLLSLLPRGPAWSRDPASVNYELLYGASEELTRIDDRSNELLVERNTKTTTELITDNELDLGLPEYCLIHGVPYEPVQTLEERRLSCNAKLITSGQQDKEYFIEIVEALGFTDVDIVENTPAFAGLAEAGDPCGDLSVLFYWTLEYNVPSDSPYYMNGGSLQAVQCAIEKYRPAHTILLYDYVGRAFDESFYASFDARETWSQEYTYGGFTRAFDVAFNTYVGGDCDYDNFSKAFSRKA